MRTLIRNGLIVDGTGRPPFQADLLIERDTIRGVGRFEDAQAKLVIDASGLHVTPGFIDCHTHSELRLMYNRQHPSAIYSGITSVVTGLCGLGFAPIRPEHFDEAIQMNAGIFENRRKHLIQWGSFWEYLDRLDGCAVNVASCVPHNAIRQMAVGFSDAPLRGEALAVAEAALDAALSEGAVGFSIGLSYYPGAYADTEELIALCRVAKRHDALFCVHSRLNIIGPSFDPLAEIAEIVEKTGVRLHMLHYATSKGNHMGDPEALQKPFENIVRKGAKVTYEFYPYLAGSSILLMFLPGWAQEGGYASIMERLETPGLRDRLLLDIEKRYHLIVDDGSHAILSATKDPYSDDLNESLDSIAQKRGVSIAEVIVLLLTENQLEIGFHLTEPEDASVRAQLFEDQYALFMQDCYTIGSDTIPMGDYCHPRIGGTYPRILRQMRERNVPIEWTIRKITAFPAELFHLKGRGSLLPGNRADICLFRYDAVKDQATFGAPRRKADGIETVLVNGKPALMDGAITGLLPGRSLGSVV